MSDSRLIVALFASATMASGGALAEGLGFNAPGNTLIADQFNNRVIEVTPEAQIVWQFGLGPDDVTARSAVGVNDAVRVGENTLISASGAPPGAEPLCPSGCADNRVMLVDPGGRVIWQYGRFGITGAGHDELNTPVQATWTPMHTILITDQANQRVIEVSHDKKVLWQYGTTGVAGARINQLNSPNSAELLDNGDILIADQSNNRAIEVTRSHKIVAAFSAGGTVSAVAFASRLSNGDTLITDSNNSRIVEVDPRDQIVWSYVTTAQPGGSPSPLPSRAFRLTLISDQFNHRVFTIDATGQTVSQYGALNTPGYDADSAQHALNAPYDAKRIGDYTGMTWSDSLHAVPQP